MRRVFALCALMLAAPATAGPRELTDADVLGGGLQGDLRLFFHEALHARDVDFEQPFTLDVTCVAQPTGRFRDCTTTNDNGATRIFIRQIMTRLRVKPGVTGPLRIHRVFHVQE